MASPTVDRRFGLVGNVAIKAPVAAVATTNIALSGQQTIDNVAVLAVNSIGVADRVLCVGQTDATKNGLYDVSLNAWSRSADGDGPYDFAKGSLVYVTGGTNYGGSAWYLTTSGPITIGTTALTWQLGVGVNLLTAVQAAQAYSALAAASASQAAAVAVGNFVQDGSGAVTRDLPDKMRDFVSIMDFIPETEHAAIRARTSAYFCDTAIANAMAISGRYAIFFPAGRYLFANTINVKKPVFFQGETGTQAGYGVTGFPQTEFYFSAGVVGIFVHRADTNADNTGTPSIVAAGGGGDSSIFKNIALTRTSGVASGPYNGKHGFWLKARATIEGCAVLNFDGNGINILAYSASSDPAVHGNANNWQISNCVSYQNQGSGLYVEGSDANAGSCDSLDVSLNLLYGLWDQSFLGNTYVAIHSSANTGGSYKTVNSANTSVFFGCYAESGQPAADLTANTLAIGGLIGGAGLTAGTQGTVLTHELNSAPFSGAMALKSIGAWDGLNVVTAMRAGDASDDPTLYFYHATYAPDAWKFFWNGGPDLKFGYGHSGANQFRFTSPGTTLQFGTTATQPGKALHINTVLGRSDVGNDGRAFSYAASPPVAGAHAQGEIVFNTSGSSGQAAAWYCTAAGVPGTWRALALITTST